MLRDLRVGLGYGAGTRLSSVSALQDEAIWAEAVGFDSFWVSQVFGVDPIVALAAVGAAVPGLAELGTSVVPLTGRHLLALAAQARTAQCGRRSLHAWRRSFAPSCDRGILR